MLRNPVRALGITIPQSLLLRAAEVVQRSSGDRSSALPLRNPGRAR
jgi:hypothetical protein